MCTKKLEGKIQEDPGCLTIHKGDSPGSCSCRPKLLKKGGKRMKKLDINKIRRTAQKAVNGLLALLVFFGENEGTIFSDKGEEVKVDKKVKIVMGEREITGRVTRVGKKYIDLLIDGRKVKVNIDKIWYVVDITEEDK
jgi:hypothetical protein